MTTGEKSGRKLTAGTKDGGQKEIYIHKSKDASDECHNCVIGSKIEKGAERRVTQLRYPTVALLTLKLGRTSHDLRLLIINVRFRHSHKQH